MYIKKIHDPVIIKKLSPEDFNQFLSRTELKAHTTFVQKALQHYFAGDYISAIHVLVPRLEGILREFLKLEGLEVLHKTADGSWEEKTLSRLLDQTSGVEKIISIDLLMYLRYLLVRKMGDNKRNEISHALLEEAEFKEVLSFRLILLILVLYIPVTATKWVNQPTKP